MVTIESILLQIYFNRNRNAWFDAKERSVTLALCGPRITNEIELQTITPCLPTMAN